MYSHLILPGLFHSWYEQSQKLLWDLEIFKHVEKNLSLLLMGIC